MQQATGHCGVVRACACRRGLLCGARAWTVGDASCALSASSASSCSSTPAPPARRHGASDVRPSGEARRGATRLTSLTCCLARRSAASACAMPLLLQLACAEAAIERLGLLLLLLRAAAVSAGRSACGPGRTGKPRSLSSTGGLLPGASDLVAAGTSARGGGSGDAASSRRASSARRSLPRVPKG